MDLEDLENLKHLNELDLLYKIKEIAESCFNDAEVVLKGKQWKAAGVRLRDEMQDIRLLSEIIRDEIQLKKKVKWGDKRVLAIDRAIEKAKEKIIRENDKILINKKKRLAKLNNRNGKKE